MSRRPARAGIPTDDSILQEESYMKKKRTWTALILIAALILIFAAPENCEAEDARILLMRCYQQDRSGVCSEAVLLDEEGCVWQYQSDDPLPDTDEERLAYLAECQNVTLDRKSTRLNYSHVSISYAVLCLR